MSSLFRNCISIDSFSCHFLSISSFSLHFLILSLFFSISLFSLHFLFSRHFLSLSLHFLIFFPLSPSLSISCHLTFHVILVILVIIEIIVTKVIMALMLKVVIKDQCVFKKWCIYHHQVKGVAVTGVDMELSQAQSGQLQRNFERGKIFQTKCTKYFKFKILSQIPLKSNLGF